jgi:hypothetical protein
VGTPMFFDEMADCVGFENQVELDFALPGLSA